jgi:cobalt-zinc-cadmium efflux system protein
MKYDPHEHIESTGQEMTTNSHDHDHDHGHSHGIGGHHHGPTEGPVLWWSLAATALFFAFELAAGYHAQSLALISDAWHNFSDALALGLAAYATWIAKKPANPQKTFGYHRVAILTALGNASTLVLIAIYIIVGAVQRLAHPVPVDSGIMMIVAVMAVFLNAGIAGFLHGHAETNINVRAAYIHMATDALSSVAVIAAGGLYRMGFTQADLIVSMLIGLFIMWSGWGIVRDATNVLLEGAPHGVDARIVAQSIAEVEYVQGVHDLHVWTVADGINFLSCHVEVDRERTMDEVDEVVSEIGEMLEHKFGIGHATIQTERVGACEVGDSEVGCTESGRKQRSQTG